MTTGMDPIAPRATGRRLIWSGAAALAISAHLGAGALALWHVEAIDPDDQPAGSIAMELAPVLTATVTTAPSTAIGPECADSAASEPQSVVKPPEPLEQQVPMAEQSPTVPEPELAVPEQVTETKPAAEQAPESNPADRRNDTAAEMSLASQAMAPPKIDAPAAQKSSAPVIGMSPRSAKAKATWHQSVATHLNRFKRYPGNAQGPAAKGEVLVQFATDRGGLVLSALVARTSGSDLLDAEAVALVRRAAPLPTPPADLAGERFTLTVPVVFRRQ